MYTDQYRKRYRAQFHRLTTRENEESIPLDALRDRLRKQEGSLELTSEQIEVLLAEADRNQDERITMEEFQSLVTSSAAQPSQIRRVLYSVADQVITPYQQVDVHSYIDSYTLCPPPIFILLVSIIEVCVFLYYFFTEPGMDDFMTDCAGCIVDHHPGIFLFAPKLRQQAWRFVSYALLHAGFGHLMGNIVMQLLIGIPLEVVHKVWRIGPLYVMAVLAGSLLQYSMDPKVMLVGASAGVYALITAHLANVIINWSEMPFRWVRMVVLAVFLSFDIGGAVYRRIFLDECDQISHAAHVAGGITGFCFGVFILYNIVEHTWEKIVRYLCVAMYITFLIFTIVMVVLRTPNDKPLWDSAACTN